MMKLRLNALAAGVASLGVAACLAAPSWAQSVKSSPKDTRSYARPAIPADTAAPPAHFTAKQTAKPLIGAAVPTVNIIKVIDAVVNNTDSNLKNTETFDDGEPSIAINPLNPNEIVMTAFSGAWGANAPLWHSTDNGSTWTKLFTIPLPPGVAGTIGCPCDQTIDYGADGTLFAVLLTEGPDNIYTGSTTNPTSAAAWSWWTIAGVAQRTNRAASSVTNADQPWLLHNRGTTNAASENVFVAYDDFGVFPVGMRVSTSINLEPPQFASDQMTGSSSGAVNPGHRFATDPRNGWVYSLFQTCITNCATLAATPKTVQYVLNRSQDQGATWTLNGSSGGIVVSTGITAQPQPKFGTVNALLGGIDHAAVDPQTGDVYVVYGSEDASGNSEIAIRRLSDNGAGGLNIGPENIVVNTGAGAGTAALPQVAVTQQGSQVGVFYYTFNGMVGGFPQFSTWLAVSADQGATFNTQLLKTFLSPSTDNGDPRQRVFGDYVQMKSVGQCFDGAFTGNGAAFGRSISNNDPIFFQACIPAGPTPFAALTGSLFISSYQPLFRLTLNLTLGTGNNGINPPAETTTLQINAFTLTIPPGSFTQTSPGHFSFNGVISGVNVTASIAQTGANTFTLQASGNPNLSRTRPDPATVTLAIGNDNGKTSLPF
jgi:hypothetical protein